ncbi:hypothetical protein C7S17_3098 [Burkholderia thailandensis]|nr:hypothetical protein [Burkholderia thailandensis]
MAIPSVIGDIAEIIPLTSKIGDDRSAMRGYLACQTDIDRTRPFDIAWRTSLKQPDARGM